MAAGGFFIFVRVALGIKVFPELLVALVEEIGLSDTYPVELGLLGEEGGYLLLGHRVDFVAHNPFSVNIRNFVDEGRGREKSHVVEGVRPSL